MKGKLPPPHEPADVGRVARELLQEFLDDAHEGQLRAIAAAAKRTLLSDKAAPVRELAREIDDVNGNLFSRALVALLSSRARKDR